jgi:hypothetical protein
MNLNSKGARRTLAVVCSTAIVAAGASFFTATAAQAATLPIGGGLNVTTLDLGTAATDTSVTRTTTTDVSSGTTLVGAASQFKQWDVGRQVANAANNLATRRIISVSSDGTTATLSSAITAATGTTIIIKSASVDTDLGAAMYASRVTSATSPVHLKLLSAPSDSAVLDVQNVNSQTSSPAAAPWVPLDTSDTADKSNDALLPLSNTGLVYFAPKDAGSYSVEFYEDIDNDGSLSSGDNVSQPIAINALNIAATNSTWLPSVSAPITSPLNAKLPVSVDLTGLTLTDARGSSAIGNALANLIGISYPAVTGITYNAAGAIGVATYKNGTAYRGADTTPAADYPTVGLDKVALGTAQFDLNGDNTRTDVTLGTTNTTLTAAPTSASTLDAVTVTGDIAQTSPTVKVRGGVSTVQYKAKAGSSSGATVQFTLTPHAGVSTSSVSCSSTTPTLTGDGTLIGTYGDGVKVYTATTDTNGYAWLKVTSSDTTADCPTYDVLATGATALTTKYQSSTPTTLNTADVVAPVGTSSVTLSAYLTDQFGSTVAPLVSKSQQAYATVGGSSTNNYVTVGSDKKFTFTYTPSTAPAAASTTSFTWTYSDAGAPVTKKITWSSTTAAGSVTLATPTDGSTGASLVGSSGLTASSGSLVSGTVAGSGGSALSYKKVTLSGTDGVYFSTNQSGSDGLSKTLDVVTNGSGQFSGAYVFYTKSGTAWITAKSDDAKAVVGVTTKDSSDPYLVSLDDAFAIGGSSNAIKGHVEDAFGNAVPGAWVDLSLSSATAGTLSTTDYATSTYYTGTTGSVVTNTSAAHATTGSDGTFSVGITPTVGTKDDFTVTGTLYKFPSLGTSAAGGGTAPAKFTSNPVADSTLSADGLKVSNGQYQDTSTLTVGPVVLSAPKTHVGQGFVQLKGKTSPNTQVTIKGRVQGSTTGLVELDTVTSDKDGDFQVLEWLTDTTTFVAVSGSGTSAQYSPSVTVVKTVSSGGKKDSVRINTKGLGKGKVLVQANGYPDKKGTLTFYVNGKKVRTATSNAKGDLNVVISTGKGKKTIKITFATSGYTTNSVSKTITVK